MLTKECGRKTSINHQLLIRKRQAAMLIKAKDFNKE
jgi:hypothetical protein